MIIYTASVPRFRSFDTARRMFRPNYMSSFGESQGLVFATTPTLALAFAEYNRSFNRCVSLAALSLESLSPYLSLSLSLSLSFSLCLSL